MAPLIDEAQTPYEEIVTDSTACFQDPAEGFSLMREGSKRVRFLDCVDMQAIPHKNDLSQEDREALWMQTKDFQAMHLDRQRTLRAAIFGELNSDSTLRGMETLLPKTATQRRQNIQACWAAIKKEQARAKAQGFSCPTHLAFVCSNATQRARQSAHVQGLEDQFEAQC